MTQPFEHKKSLGQHFLNNPRVPLAMVEAAAVGETDTVLEIGPGTGALTEALLATGARVIAIEADERAIAELSVTAADPIARKQLTLIHADARKLDLPHYGLVDHGFKVVANIPYYLSGLLFRQLLEGSCQPTDLVFLVQKEVAKRAVGSVERGGKSSLLSLSLEAYGTVSYIKTISRGNFTPPPQVDSAIIAVSDISRKHFAADRPEALFFELLHLGFGQKRKQLQHNLRQRYDATLVADALTACSLPLTVRAEDVPLEAWLQLTAHFHTTNT